MGLDVLKSKQCKRKYFDPHNLSFNVEDELCAAGAFKLRFRKVFFNHDFTNFTTGDIEEEKKVHLGEEKSTKITGLHQTIPCTEVKA